jgi:hypothetical protein
MGNQALTERVKMVKRYQVTQIRSDDSDHEIWDAYPVLFASLEDARSRINRDGLAFMFEHEGDYYYIAELQSYRNGVSYTGKQFPV